GKARVSPPNAGSSPNGDEVVSANGDAGSSKAGDGCWSHGVGSGMIGGSLANGDIVSPAAPLSTGPAAHGEISGVTSGAGSGAAAGVAAICWSSSKDMRGKARVSPPVIGAGSSHGDG